MSDTDTDAFSVESPDGIPTENWRPTATGTALGVVLAVVIGATLVTTSGTFLAGGAAAIGGGLLAVSLLLADVSRWAIPARVLGGLLLLPAGGLLLLGLVVPLQATQLGMTVLVVGIGIAAGGAAAMPWEGATPGRLAGGIFLGIATLVLPGLAAVTSFLAHVLDTRAAVTTSYGTPTPLASNVLALFDLLDEFVSVGSEVLLAGPSLSDIGAVVTFVGLLAVASLSASWALRALPIAELVEVDRRDVVAARVTRARRSLVTVTALSLAVLPLLASLWIGTATRTAVLGALPGWVVGLVFGLTGATLVRQILLLVSVLGFGTVVLVPLLRRAHGTDALAALRWLAPLVAGLVFVAGPALVGPSAILAVIRGQLGNQAPAVSALASQFGPITLVLGMEMVLVVIPVLVCATLYPAGYLLFPDRAAGAAVVSAGLFVSTVGAAYAGLPPLVVFVTVAGTLIIWDVSEHAATLGAEVGRAARTRHVELAHATGVLLVGIVGIFLVVGSLAAATRLSTLTSSLTAPVALLSALLGVVLFLVLLRTA